MMDLFTDSNEVVQKLWAKDICLNFPAYKAFWDEFIGERQINGVLEPYKVEFPNTPSVEEKTKLQDRYKEISVVHYCIFFNFASAHHDFDLINKILTEKNDEKYFLYLKSINSIYTNLGNIFYFLNKLYSNVLTLVNRKGGREFKDYLESKSLFLDYASLEETIQQTRHILTHAYSVIPMAIDETGVKIPSNWKNQNGNYKTASELLAENKNGWVSFPSVIKKDIEKMEFLVNKIDLHFLNELQEFKRINNIRINYPANTPSYEMPSLPSLSANPVSSSTIITKSSIIKPSGTQDLI